MKCIYIKRYGKILRYIGKPEVRYKYTTLFDARDNNKPNQTYFYKSSVRFTTASAFLFSGPFYPTRMDHITPNMDHPVGVYFSLYFLNMAVERNKFCMIMIIRYQPLNREINKKSYIFLKHDNGRYCWMGIRRMK